MPNKSTKKVTQKKVAPHTGSKPRKTNITELNLSEQTLNMSEEILHQAQSASGVGTYDWDLAKQVARCSEEYFHVMGVAPRDGGQITFTEWQSWIYQDDRERVMREMEIALGQAEEIAGDYRILSEDGRTRWINYWGKIRRDAAGNPIRVLGTVLDITEHKRIEEALRERTCELSRSNTQLSTILDSLTEGLVIADLEGNLFHWNPAAIAMHGFATMEECKRKLVEFKKIFELSTKEEGILPVEKWPLARIMKGEKLRDWEVNVRRLDRDWSKIFGYGGTLARDKEGKPIVAVVTVADITERKRAEQALRESEGRLRKVQEIAYLGSWELDLVNNYLYWSDEVYRIFGLQPQEFTATYDAFLEAVHPDDRAAVDEAYSGSLREGKDSYEIEHRVVRKSTGEIRVVHEKCEHLRDKSGRIIRSIGMVHDITERKQMEELLRKSRDELEIRVQERTKELRKTSEELKIERKRFYDVLEMLPVYVVLLTTDYHVAFANRFFRERFGEDKGRRCYEYLFNRAEPCEICETYKVLKTNLSHHWEWTGPDGCNYDIYDYPFTDVDGSPLIMEMGIDISERKKAEEDLRLSETRYRALMEQAPEAIVLLNRNMNTIEVNTMACRITGYTREELLSIDTRNILSPDEIDDTAFSFQRVLSGETVVEKRKLLKRDGSVITIEASVKMIQDRLIQVIFHDITARIEEENRVTTTNILLELFAKSSSRKEYLDSVVQVIHQWSGFRCIGIRVLDSSGYIPYESYTGFSHEFLKLENILSLKKDMCACIRSFTGKFEPVDASILTPKGSVCINDSQKFASSLTKDELARFRGNCIKSGFLTIVLIPLRYGGKPLGLIHLADERAGMASFSVVQFLETISHLIGEAIHRFNTEEALRKSEASLSEAQRIAHVGNWEWDVNTDQFYWSVEVYRVFGLSPHQFTPTYNAFLGFVHSDDRESLEESIKEAFYQKTPYAIDYRIVLQDGRERTVHEQGEIIFNEKGAPLRMVGTIQDITEIKRIENELLESQEQLRKLYSHLQSAREQEKKQIARELHDEFGSILTALKVDLSWLKQKMPEEEARLREKLEGDLDLVGSAIKHVQRISSELRPLVLDHLGLTAAMEWQLKQFANRSGIQWDMSINMESTNFDMDFSIAVFRIFQEVLTNIIRHAEATKINVDLQKRDGYLILDIVDNGKGIPEEKLSDHSSFGLMGMKERTQYLGGNLEIKGIINKGTTVTLRIPMKTKD